MRILVAPNPFKGTLSASEAARAMALGLGQAWPSARVERMPLADGGPGTLEALQASLGGSLRRVRVLGGHGQAVLARILHLPSGAVALCAADACGLGLAGPLKGRALLAHSFGLGQLLLKARALGAKQVLLGLGGTACTDGGTGMAKALGWRFEDARGRELALGGGALQGLHRVIPPVESPLRGLRIKALCDVDNPLSGALGAAKVFSPQKSASPAQVQRLERGLKALGKRLPKGIAARPGAGAAGGLGAGLLAFSGAALVPGAATLFDACRFNKRLSACSLLVSGEGRLDAQSLRGKLPIHLAQQAKARGIPCLLVAGQVQGSLASFKAKGATWVIDLSKGSLDPKQQAFKAIQIGLGSWASKSNCQHFINIKLAR